MLTPTEATLPIEDIPPFFMPSTVVDTQSPEVLPEYVNDSSNEDKTPVEEPSPSEQVVQQFIEPPVNEEREYLYLISIEFLEKNLTNDLFYYLAIAPIGTCDKDVDCESPGFQEEPKPEEPEILAEEDETESEFSFEKLKLDQNFFKTLTYLGLTAITTLIFSLGYYYIEASLFYYKQL